MSLGKVLLTRRIAAVSRAEFSRRFQVVGPEDRDLNTEEALELADGVDAIAFGPNLRLDATSIARLPKRVRIAATLSVGFDHIDLEAARARGLVVTNTPGVLDDCTADYAFMLLLMAARRVKAQMRYIEAGWNRPILFDEMLGTRVSGKVLGIVGMGRIGRAVADRARGFGMDVHYHNRSRLAATEEKGAIWHETLPALLGAVDMVMLHLPGGGRPVMDAAALAAMRPGSILVNAARGSVLDEAALLQALDRGHIAAAGLDVFASEPGPNPALVAHPSVVATPHMASATLDTRHAMALSACDSIAACLSGAPVPCRIA